MIININNKDNIRMKKRVLIININQIRKDKHLNKV